MDYQEIVKILKDKAEERFREFEKVPEGDNLVSNIETEAYIQKPKWIGGTKDYVILFIDLIGSSRLSDERYKGTVAQIYDYFTQSIVDCLDASGYYSYIDIKGDGVFALYEGEKSIEKAFIDCINFRTFFEEHVSKKFEYSEGKPLQCKCSIHEDKILVRKIGNKQFRNEVWAGRLVNTASEMMKLVRDLKENNQNLYPIPTRNSFLVVSDKIYKKLEHKYREHAVYSCDCTNNSKLWKEVEISPDKAISSIEKCHIASSIWCKNCGQATLESIIS